MKTGEFRFHSMIAKKLSNSKKWQLIIDFGNFNVPAQWYDPAKAYAESVVGINLENIYFKWLAEKKLLLEFMPESDTEEKIL